MLNEFTFAEIGLYGRAEALLVFSAAHEEAPSPQRLGEIDVLFGLDDDSAAIVYVDRQREISKRAVAPNGKLSGVRLSGETQARTWIKEAMAENTLDAALLRWVVAPVGKRPNDLPLRSRVICKCADVSEAEIAADLAAGATWRTLQDKRKCGTFCGACLPEIRRVVAGHTTSVVSQPLF